MAEAEEEGAAPRAQSPEPLRPRHAHVHKIPSAPGPNAPSQDPEGGLGGAQLQNRSLGPHAPCPAQPLLPSWVQGVRRCSGGQTAVLTVLSFPLVTH